MHLSRKKSANGAFNIKNFSGLTQDSRQVKDGYFYAALPGAKTDGKFYIGDAIRSGARGVLAQTGTGLPLDIDPSEIVLITDDNPRRKLALLAAEFYGRQPGYIVAVSGTNGKTSTVNFVDQLWSALHLKSASIGTLGARAGGKVRSTSMTTPDPVSLHAELADLAAVGITHLALEASSHGLDQYRLDGVKVSVGAFTSFSHDHLDYHPTMDEYFIAKSRLFGEVMQVGSSAVLNADIPEFEGLEKVCKQAGHKIYSYGRKGKDFKLVSLEALPQGQRIGLEVLGRRLSLTLSLIGSFQVMNALCALACAVAEKPEDQKRTGILIQAMENLHGVPGRLELVPAEGKSFAAYVDYAHTPDALESVLNALRPHTSSRLVCVFGCGGSRDRGKRPVMGRIAAKLADLVVVTDDNPRNENPETIRQEILDGIPQEVKEVHDIADRREAIRFAVQNLRQGDVLVVAGKGHEQGQIFDGYHQAFDDVEEVTKAIKECKA